MKFRVASHSHIYSHGFKVKVLDWWDNTKTSFFVFWDFKYKKERKAKKALLKPGQMERIPVEKAVNKDVNNMGYKANSQTSSMKYVKTKGGAVVVTPASMRSIRADYKDSELVEARIKSHADLKEQNGHD